MKKPVLIFAVMSFVLALACVSCSNSAGGGGSDSAATGAGSGGTGGTENPSGGSGGSGGQQQGGETPNPISNTINATTENIVQIINELTKDAKLVVTGKGSDDLIWDIGTALRQKTEIKVDLDLSSVTGVSEIPAKIRIGTCVFGDCLSLEKISLPNSVTKIGYNVFEGCTNLKDILLSNNLTEIGINVFKNCTSLETISIPSTLTKIGTSVFEGCSSLKNITIPNGITRIGMNTFKGCTKLSVISLSNTVTEIGESAFEDCSCLKDITIPNGVEKIGKNAFKNSANPSSLTIPVSVTEIADGAFDGCSNIESITIPDSKFAPLFRNARVKTVAFNKAIKYIGYFTGYQYLTEFTIPNTVKSIIAGAFKDCISLSNVTIPNSVTEIGGAEWDETQQKWSYGDGAFENCASLTKIFIPSSVWSIGGKAFFGCTNLETVTMPGKKSTFNGIVDYAKYYTYGVQGVTMAKEVVIPLKNLTITGCEDDATGHGSGGMIPLGYFNRCRTLKNVTITGSLKIIDKYAFELCSALESVAIPDGVEEIGYQAFLGCSSLKSIVINNSSNKIWSRYRSVPGGNTYKEEMNNVADLVIGTSIANGPEETATYLTGSGSEFWFKKK